jgi:hypothetical protein
MLVQNLSAGVGQDATAREIAEPIVDNKFHHRGGDLVVNLYCQVLMVTNPIEEHPVSISSSASL